MELSPTGNFCFKNINTPRKDNDMDEQDLKFIKEQIKGPQNRTKSVSLNLVLQHVFLEHQEWVLLFKQIYVYMFVKDDI